MCKFSQAAYTKDAIAELIKKLHACDEYPYDILGDYAGLSASMMRQVADGNRSLKAHHFATLRYHLARRDGNTRAFNIGMPPGWCVIRIGEVRANGCPDDEVIDGGEALYAFRDGHRSTNLDVIDNAIDRTEQVLERMKAERSRVAGRAQ